MEILFRGMTLEGEWIYGDLVHDAVNAYSKRIEVGINERGAYPVEVIPKTVGQFIGLLDKNGAKIFDGTITKHHAHGTIGRWIFSDKYNCFMMIDEDGMDRFYFKIDSPELEVIGTIHDREEEK